MGITQIAFMTFQITSPNKGRNMDIIRCVTEQYQ